MIEVAAAILRDEEGKILICRRGAGGNCAFRWEFPGGKREKGESWEACLKRECREELGIDVRLDGVFKEFEYAYPDKRIRFCFMTGRILSGELVMKVHEDMKWEWPENLLRYDFCPADEDVIAELAQGGQR